MNKRILSKLLIIVLLVIMVINNISYAINITKDDLKKSLHKIFGSDIEIETIFKTEVIPGEGVTIEGDGTVTSTSKTTYDAPTEVSITDSQIILKEVEDGQEMLIKIDYTLENNKCIFDMNSSLKDFGMDENDPESSAFMLIGILMMQSEAMANGFMAAADYLGIDLNLAHSYYSQIINFAEEGQKDDEGVYSQIMESDVFKYILTYNENTINVHSNIEIDVEKLAELTDADLNGKAISTVKLLNTPNLEDGNEEENTVDNNETNNTVNNTTNNTVNNAVNNTTNNTVNKTNNNVVNNTVNNVANKVNNIVNNSSSKTADNTTSNIKIPAAGSETMYYILSSVVTISILVYIKLRKYDDVK